jgi:hypothetical protein
MKYIAPSITVLAVFALAYATFSQWLIDTSASSTSGTSWLSYIAIVFISLVASMAANVTTFTRMRNTDRRLADAQRVAAGKKERITGPLIEGLQDLLVREVAKIRETSELVGKIEEEQGRPVVFHVQVKIDGLYRVIASTSDYQSGIRRQAFNPTEGILGYAISNKFGYVVASKDEEGNWTIFDQSVKYEIGQQGPLTKFNQDRSDQDLKWVTVTPIYDRPEYAPWSDNINGAMSVSGYHDKAKELFADRSFQSQVENTRHAVEHLVEAFVALKDIDSFDS